MDKQVHYLRSMRFILFIYVIMTWGWGFLMMNSLGNIATRFIFLLPAFPAIPLLCLSIWFARSVSGLHGPTLFGERGKRWLYFAMLALTFIGFFAARIICAAIGHPFWAIPAIPFMLGLHFLGLVPIFEARAHGYLTALVFCLTALIVPLFVPMDFTLGRLVVVVGWQLAIGALCWLWLLGTAIHILISGTLLRQQVVLSELRTQKLTAGIEC